MDGPQYIVWALAKLAVALVILYLWYRLIRFKVVPLFKEQPAGQAKPRRLPLLSLAALVVLSVGAVLFSQAELAFRQVAETPDRSIDRHRAAQLEKEATEPAPTVPPDGNESLKDRTQRMKDEAAKANEKAKEGFIKENKKTP